MVTDALFSFGEAATPASNIVPAPMTPEQRIQIRELFAHLGVSEASRQFAIVKELTGVEVSQVGDMRASTAQRVIEGIRNRLARTGHVRSGSDWDTREEDTWIDRL